MAQKSARRDNLTNGISPTKTHIISSIHNLLRCYLQWMKGPSCRHRAEPLSTHSAGGSDGRETCLLFSSLIGEKSLGGCCQKKTASRKKKTRAGCFKVPRVSLARGISRAGYRTRGSGLACTVISPTRAGLRSAGSVASSPLYGGGQNLVFRGLKISSHC